MNFGPSFRKIYIKTFPEKFILRLRKELIEKSFDFLVRENILVYDTEMFP